MAPHLSYGLLRINPILRCILLILRCGCALPQCNSLGSPTTSFRPSLTTSSPLIGPPFALWSTSDFAVTNMSFCFVSCSISYRHLLSRNMLTRSLISLNSFQPTLLILIHYPKPLDSLMGSMMTSVQLSSFSVLAISILLVRSLCYRRKRWSLYTSPRHCPAMAQCCYHLHHRGRLWAHQLLMTSAHLTTAIQLLDILLSMTSSNRSTHIVRHAVYACSVAKNGTKATNVLLLCSSMLFSRSGHFVKTLSLKTLR